MKRLPTLIILIMMTTSFGVKAQEDITLSTLGIDLWPEYDQPNVLVIFNATLSPEVTLPAELTFRIPVDARVHAVAVRQVNGTLYNAFYEGQVVGNWEEITFTATTPQVRLEYYDESLVKQGTQRQYAFQWPGDYAVDALVVQVQQPIDASDMSISPSMGNGTTAENGLVYYNAEVGSLAQGETFTLSLSYQKETDTLTTEALNLEPPVPITAETPGRVDVAKILPWVLGTLGALLLVGGGLWYWQSRQPDDSPKARRSRASKAKAEVASSTGTIYCHQCGKRAGPGDRYCRSCGTRLRVE